MRDAVFTVSWDDGYPADRRLGDLLAKYGIAGTFYIPTRNGEGRAVMEMADIAALAQGFEIGGHTWDHAVLPGLPLDNAFDQISRNKTWLEQVIGAPVRGFCYPRGKLDSATTALVKKAGYSYARTTRVFCTNCTADCFLMPTTMQFFPHDKSVYPRNLLRGPLRRERIRMFVTAMHSKNLCERALRMIDLGLEAGGVIHMWGHSWEIEAYDLWKDLETVLRHVESAFLKSCRLSNEETLRWTAGEARRKGI